MYDKEKIEQVVNIKRKSFRIKVGTLVFCFLAALIIALLRIDDSITFLCLISEFPYLFLLIRACNRYDARSLFCPEIKGKNIKEYEYAINGDGTGRVFQRGNVPRIYSNRKLPHLRLNGTVYLELEDGSIKSFSGMYKSHMDIYEDGDTLLKYAGTKFPVVLGREVKKQPCPICGEVNDMTREECRVCGLGIVKRRT